MLVAALLRICFAELSGGVLDLNAMVMRTRPPIKVTTHRKYYCDNKAYSSFIKRYQYIILHRSKISYKAYYYAAGGREYEWWKYPES